MPAARFTSLSERIRRFGPFSVCHLHLIVRSLSKQLETLPASSRGNVSLRAIQASRTTGVRINVQDGCRSSHEGSWHTRRIKSDASIGQFDEVYQLAILACWFVTGLKPKCKEHSRNAAEFYQESLDEHCNASVAELLVSVLASPNGTFATVAEFLNELDVAVATIGGWRTGAKIQTNARSSIFEVGSGNEPSDLVVKILHRKYANNERQLGRFFLAAKIPMEHSFNGMPVVEEVGSDGPWFYSVMPRMTGRTLEETVVANGPYSADQALEKVALVCEVLACAHQRGLVHRNLHPGNIFVGHGGKITATGWGTALRQNAEFDLVQTGRGAGHPAFAAPEQMNDATIADASSDVFAIGSILYFMLTGEAPFSSESRRICLLQKTKSLRWRELLIEKACPAYLIGLFDRIFRTRHKRMIASARHLSGACNKIRRLLIEDEQSHAPLQIEGGVVSRTSEKLSELTNNLLDRQKSVLQTVYEHTFSECR